MKRQKWSLTRTAAILLVLLVAVTFSGCTDESKEPVDRTAIYVYQEGFDEEGDPEDDISKFYTWASAESGGDEKAGEPVPIPVTRYAIEENPETGETSIYDSQSNLVDPKDIPDNWNDLIVKDESGMPITDPSKFLHVERIGKNKYEIHGLAQEMKDSNGDLWRCYDGVVNINTAVRGDLLEGIVVYRNGEYDDKASQKFIYKCNEMAESDIVSITGTLDRNLDNILKVDGEYGEMTAGIVHGEDRNSYAVMIFDDDLFELGNNALSVDKMIANDNFDVAEIGEKSDWDWMTDMAHMDIKKEACTKVADGIYVYVCKLPEKDSVFYNGEKNINKRKGIALKANQGNLARNMRSEDGYLIIELINEGLVVEIIDKSLQNFVDKIAITKIGNNKYQIDGLAQEMPDPDGGVWRKVFEKIGPYVDEKLVDNVIGNEDAEITGGFVRGENGDVWGVVIANEKQFEIYGGDFGLCVGGENTRTVPKYYCYDTKRGLYIYIHDLSQLPEWNRDDGDRIIEKSLSIDSLNAFGEEIDIAKKEGKYPYFRFEKTAS